MGTLKKIAVLVDELNLRFTTENLGFNINFNALLGKIKGAEGKLEILMYFCDRALQSCKFLHALEQSGFSIMAVSPKVYSHLNTGAKIRKSRTDAMLIVQGMNILYTKDIQHLVLVSGDADYQFLIEAYQAHNKTVEVWSTSRFLAPEIRQIANEVCLFDDLRHKNLLVKKNRL